MAMSTTPITGTYTRYTAQGLREQLHNSIYDISPMDFPFSTGVGRGERSVTTLMEWQTDSLAAPDGSNSHVDGFEAAFETPTPTVRVGNHTQILAKTAIVSGTLEEADKAGRRSEMAYQMSRRSKEIRRDLETIFLQNQAGTAGSTSVSRKMASLPAWIKTVVNKAGDGTNPSYTAGVPNGTRGDGTQRAYTETISNSLMQAAFNAGAEPSVLMLGAYNKTVASTFSGIASRTINIDDASVGPMSVVQSVDVIVTNFGTLRVIPNRFQRGRDAWYLDFQMLGAGFYRPFRSEPLAKTGDAVKRLLLGEVTLKVRNEAGIGLVADLTTSA